MAQRVNKWTSQSNKGIYLGQSWSHASTVDPVNNLQTSYITPQHHLTFDEQFTTVDDDVITDTYK